MTRSQRTRLWRESVSVRRRMPTVIAVAVIVLIAAITYVYLGRYRPIPGVTLFPDVPRGHDNDVVLSLDDGLPPAGGVHSDRWQTCGIYTEPVVLEHVVHSLEHGAVWIAYQPTLSPQEVAQLQERVRGEPFIVLSPQPGLSSPVVLTSWGAQLEVGAIDDERIATFIEQYRLGPMTPERGATCDGGVGDPLP